MLKKELICYIETNEENEFIKVNALESDPGFFLLSLGANRIVVNGAEFVEAISSISTYSTLFAEERKRREQAQAAPPKTVVVEASPKRARKKQAEEEEGTIVLEPTLRMGPTESELALERQTRHMKGDTIVLKEE